MCSGGPSLRLRNPPPSRPSLTQGERAKAAATEILRNKDLSVRNAAERYGVNHISLIMYWLKQWQGTEMEEAAQRNVALEPQAPSNSSASMSVTCESSASSSGASSSLASASQLDLSRKSGKAAFNVKREMIMDAINLQRRVCQ